MTNNIVSFEYTSTLDIATVEISLDNGENWYKIPDEQNPKFNKNLPSFTIKCRFTTAGGKTLELDLFDKQIIYIDKTSRDYVIDLLDRYGKNVKYENLEETLKCFHSSFSGNPPKYTDYYTIQSSIRKAYNNEKTEDDVKWENLSIKEGADEINIEVDYLRTLSLLNGVSIFNDKNRLRLIICKDKGYWKFWRDAFL